VGGRLEGDHVDQTRSSLPQGLGCALRSCFVAILVLLALLGAVWLWMREPSIERLHAESAKLGGGATIPEGGFDFWKGAQDIDLTLMGPGIGDAELARIAGMDAFKRVTGLGLGDTRVTDAGVLLLANHPSLRGLDLSRTKITDKSIQSLTTIPGLQQMNLSGTDITDAGLETFKDLPASVRLSLNVTDTAVTDLGVQGLARAWEPRGTTITYGSSKAPKRTR
jgi:hypothetical protein